MVLQLEGSKVKHQLSEEERGLLAQLKGSRGDSRGGLQQTKDSKREVAPLFRPKKKAKGPNPLSVKKKKGGEKPPGGEEKKKRKRKKGGGGQQNNEK